MQEFINMQELVNKIRMRAITMAYECGVNVHIGGGLSIIEVVAVLYGRVLRNIREDVPYNEKDKFILSKGHGALGLYAAMGETGVLSDEQLLTFQQNGSALVAHPVMNLELGIESSNGSLGQGVSMAVGLALSAKKKNKPYHTYVLVGNGECDEGIVWEACASAVQFKLDNLTVIIDDNKMQSDGFSENIIAINNFAERLNAFGFDVEEIDGHNVLEIEEALTNKREEGKPKAIIANTIKGKGVSFMENNNGWHHGRLTEEQYLKALYELERNYVHGD